ncbi:hypothetical protein FGIG_00860 [Fasciola gigantica]|uniref:Kazal-like domain-containing protein n=1 Tax=Fasciola gigantica TaxID=46835 RepID=A0A504Z1L9_FASGI|nr:hypothetical protein FGIG_00860 [Fasciola gigantica]
MVNISTQTECCAIGGFYLNRMLTQREYLNDHLIFELGTPNCVNACTEVQKPTCEGYFCPEGYFCRLVDEQPFCQCRPQCELTDYLSGPICTSNLRRFPDRCQMKKAYCDSPNQVFEIVPCLNTEQLFCSRASRLTNANKLMTWLDNSASTWRERQRRHPSWIVRRFAGTQKRSDALWFDEHQLTERQGATQYQMDPDLWQILQPGDADDRVDELGSGLVCPDGQFCLLRQFDGRPMCTGLLTDRSAGLNDQESCIREPFSTPKCGVDNRTYVSECELKLAGLEKQLEVRIAYEGPCIAQATCNNVVCPREGMVCRPHHATGQPVCLDCANLPTDCNASFRKSRITDLKRDNVIRFGDPKWSAQTQTNGWPTVCGSNRRTYANTCFLHVVNCLSNRFVDLSPPQHCEASESSDSAEVPADNRAGGDRSGGNSNGGRGGRGGGGGFRLFARSE